MLQLKNIVKSYHTGDFDQIALNDVSVSFRENEFVAILGESGSGKTTMLNLIGGLDHADSGDLLIHQKSTKKFKDRDWDAYRNHSIGFVFQNYNLITHLNLMENVEMGMTLSGVSKSERREKSLAVLDRVGLGDHVRKKPNQLSGGQMQRVAIARALVNDPEIILADEPTGALDSVTSAQIMDLIKEIAEEKLVVMVTHNAKLAEKYANRIVRLADGVIIDDTNPFKEESAEQEYKLKKTSMSPFTALKLSGRNILTKKWRTFLTAFAASIGIIGVALILSLSNGFDQEITSLESETMAGYPITISEGESVVSMGPSGHMMDSAEEEASEYPDEEVVYLYNAEDETDYHDNIITEDYLEYIYDMDETLLAGISYTRSAEMNILKIDDDKAVVLKTSLINFQEYPVQVNSEREDYLETNYDVLAGELPGDMTDLVLIVDEQNNVDASILTALGFDSEAEEIDFEDIVDQEYKLILNSDYYVQDGDYFKVNGDASNLSDLYDSESAETLTITGVIRIKEDASAGNLSAGIGYSDDLMMYFIEDAKDSDIVMTQKDVDYNVLTGEVFLSEDEVSTDSSSSEGFQQFSANTAAVSGITKDDFLESLGADELPDTITLYPMDFESKEKITQYLEEYNEGLEDDNKVIYTDLASLITDTIGSTLDAIAIVLVAFASISLVVSLIMVGIITYISVLERTKEIGILRALGARKTDISNVFNAETFIIGAVAGGLGVGIAYLMTIPINQIMFDMTGMEGISQLDPVHAGLLVLISVTLTVIGGLIPARLAAKKDPVEALRTD
jgi:putative ABC transport system permease protein